MLVYMAGAHRSAHLTLLRTARIGPALAIRLKREAELLPTSIYNAEVIVRSGVLPSES